MTHKKVTYSQLLYVHRLSHGLYFKVIIRFVYFFLGGVPVGPSPQRQFLIACEVSFKHLHQPIRTHIKSFGTQWILFLKLFKKLYKQGKHAFSIPLRAIFRWAPPIYVLLCVCLSVCLCVCPTRNFLKTWKKRKVHRIAWFGEKIDQKNFLKILPPPQKNF